ncbi:DUF937 domain-containing protein [Pseudolysinimonas sp.]|uniref:DUF937 domain-containing protein n=1 Tax=Pseudolysinimonas sp. TaxID=2680009 RepID=UPI00286CDD1E|nr:DUF937 domain-containing protein [Pseudolysinimonas sp.]
MADLSSLLKQIPVDDIAEQLGIDESVAEAAVQQIVPGLVAGLAANAEDPKGAASLEKALSHDRGAVHKKRVADIDTEDGKKIVKNVYGDKQDAVATKLAASATKASGASDVTGDIIKQILPIVAPIVLAWLAEQFLGGKKEEPAAKEEESTSGGIGDLLGGLLGGGSSSGSSNSTGDLLGGILGGLLGGGKK